MKSNHIISIYFGYHDSCVTFSSEEKILLHLEAERYFRKKHMQATAEEMMELIGTGLNYLNLNIEDFNKLYLAKWNNKFNSDIVKIFGKSFTPILTSHHNNHIGTIYPFNYDDCLVVCADGGSEDGTTKFYLVNNRTVTLLDDFDDEIITGKFYGTITQMIIDPDFHKAHDTNPGKTMGLSGLGDLSDEFIGLFHTYWRDLNVLKTTGLNELLKNFKISDDYSKPWLDKRRCDLAYTAQYYWENKFMDKIKQYSSLSRNIALVGGCALNVLLNTKLEQSKLFNNIYLSPVSGDNGQSLGAILFDNPTIRCDYPFLGRGFGELDFIPEHIISDLMSHKIIAWYQGKSEIGARALGHRSLIGLPDSIDIKIKISQRIKKREMYRPVAPIISEDDLSNYFETNQISPFMTYSPLAKTNTTTYAPAIVHHDGTSRVQTINKHSNSILYQILKEIGKEAEAPILMNTSFNVNAEPIVDTPEDALKNFTSSEIDVLYINGKRYKK